MTERVRRRGTRLPIEPRLWGRTQLVGECWIYQGNKRADGYGRVSYLGRKIGAHRASYMASRGVEIPPGAVVMHICDNPPCVNPGHLRLGTDRTKTHCPQGHPYSGENLRVFNGKRHCRACQRAWASTRRRGTRSAQTKEASDA